MVVDTSIETRSVGGFTIADYVVFVLLLFVNGVVGLYYAIQDKRRKRENTREYLLGGGNQRVVPVALSLGVTFLSANTMLGTPVDTYYHHTMYMYLVLGLTLAIVGAAWIFVPFFYRLGYTSTFQYLEDRFSPQVRTLAVSFTVCQTLTYMAFVLYAPSLALSAVTGFSFERCVIVMGVVVTFYTSLGGMKTVLYTDTIQSVIMLAGLLAIFIQGLRVMGGWTKVWDIADDRGRVLFDDFSFEPNVRHSFFSVVFGAGSMWLAIFGVNQAQVQRCLCTSSVSRARLAILVSLPFMITLVLLCCIIGIIMFAFYADCDPVKFGVIAKKDQLLPLFMLDILSHVTGFPGLFVSSVFAGSLSSLSSGLNAVAAVLFEELRRGLHLKLSETRAVYLTKIIAIVSGAVSIGLAFCAASLGTLQQAVITIFGLLNGPLFGVFVLGMFFPWANSIGAFVGFSASVAFMTWIGVGGFINQIKTNVLSPTTTVGCNWPNGTELVATNMTELTTKLPEYSGVDSLYTLSYLNYTMVGTVVVIIVGLIVSGLTGFTRPSDLNPKLVMPMFYLMEAPMQSEVTMKSADKKRKSNKNGIDHAEDKNGHNTYLEMTPTSTPNGNNNV